MRAGTVEDGRWKVPMSINDRFEKLADRISTAAGRPMSTFVACVIIIVWAATGPFVHFSDTWQLVVNTGTTIITFLMVFLIQSTQNRDTKALQVKLDELIRATNGARREFIGVEKEPEHVMEDRRQRLAGEA